MHTGKSQLFKNDEFYFFIILRDYTSGKVTSKFYRKFGKIEIRAKTPKGRGLWPAIWMMPQFR